jgi:hypothetical protein
MTNQTPDGVPEEIRELIRKQSHVQIDDDSQVMCFQMGASWMYHHLSQSPKGTPDESEVEKHPAEKSQRYIPMTESPDDGGASLRKLVREAHNANAALQDRIQSLTSDLAKAREEATEYFSMLKELQESKFGNATIYKIGKRLLAMAQHKPQ